MTRIRVGTVEEFTHGGVTGVRTQVEVAGETWDLGCINLGHLLDTGDLRCGWKFKQGRWDGDWLNRDHMHIEVMQKVLTAAHEKLRPYVESLRANDNAASAVRTLE